MVFGHGHGSRKRPIGHAPGNECGGEEQVVLIGRLLADARAAAFPHLAREAWPAALFPSEEAPAQAVLAREPFEHRLHMGARGKGTIERLSTVQLARR